MLPTMKIGAFKQKLEFWTTSIHHKDADNFTIPKDFPDEIEGDVSTIVIF